jgi:hypothetical protein
VSLAVGALLVAATLGICSVELGANSTTTQRWAQPRGPSSPPPALLSAEIASALHQRELPSSLAPPLGIATSEKLQPSTFPGRCILTGLDQTSVPICSFGDSSAARTMVLLGDSQAEMFIAAFDKAASELGWRLVVLEKPACPPWEKSFPLPSGGPFPACTAFHRFTATTLARIHPQVVVMAAWTHWRSTEDAPAFDSLISTVRAAGAEPVLLTPIPSYARAGLTGDPISCLQTHPNDIQTCSVSLAATHTNFAEPDRAMGQVATQRHAPVIDISPLFCVRGSCPLIVAERLVMRDKYHLTETWSHYIGTSLASLLAPVLPAQSPRS